MCVRRSRQAPRRSAPASVSRYARRGSSPDHASRESTWPGPPTGARESRRLGPVELQTGGDARGSHDAREGTSLTWAGKAVAQDASEIGQDQAVVQDAQAEWRWPRGPDPPALGGRRPSPRLHRARRLQAVCPADHLLALPLAPVRAPPPRAGADDPGARLRVL